MLYSLGYLQCEDWNAFVALSELASCPMKECLGTWGTAETLLSASEEESTAPATPEDTTLGPLSKAGIIRYYSVYRQREQMAKNIEE